MLPTPPPTYRLISVRAQNRYANTTRIEETIHRKNGTNLLSYTLTQETGYVTFLTRRCLP